MGRFGVHNGRRWTGWGGRWCVRSVHRSGWTWRKQRRSRRWCRGGALAAPLGPWLPAPRRVARTRLGARGRRHPRLAGLRQVAATSRVTGRRTAPEMGRRTTATVAVHGGMFHASAQIRDVWSHGTYAGSADEQMKREQLDTFRVLVAIVDACVDTGNVISVR